MISISTAKMLSLAACAILLGGCASTDYSKGNATSKHLNQTSEAVREQRMALQLAMGSLEDLINAPAGDLRPQIKRVRASNTRLASASDRTVQSCNSMREAGAKFLEEWDRTLAGMTFPAVRDSSQVRRDEVSQRLDLVSQRCGEVQEVVQPLISYLRDIERALGTDLTLEGLQRLKPIAANARTNSQKVDFALEKLAEALSDASAKMSPITQTPAAKPATTLP